MQRSRAPFWVFYVIVILTILPLLGFFEAGMPITHDGKDQVVRVANFYQSLIEGNIVPRWAANLNWGYGHPVIQFLYPLPSYIASFFHSMGLPFVDSVKSVFIVTYVFGAIGMYVWMSERWGYVAGYMGAILYSFAPYRFVDMFVRGALGEHVAFAVVPYVFWAIDRIERKISGSVLWLSIAVLVLILSHNAISLMMVYVAFIYSMGIVYRIGRFKRVSFVVLILTGFAFGFLLAAFYWIPAFIEGKYTLRDIVTTGGMVDRFVPFVHFFYSPWSFGGSDVLSKEIGWIHWGGIVLSVFLFVRKSPVSTRFYSVLFLGVFAGSLILMTRISLPFWNTVSLMQKFQFPWRLLTVTTFASSLVGGIVFAFIQDHIRIRVVRSLYVVILTLLIVSTTSHMWKIYALDRRPDSFYQEIYAGTTDTGESSPIWSVRFMEHYPEAPIESITAATPITITTRTTTRHVYEIEVPIKTRFVENTLYFPGWRVLVDGVETPIEFQDPTYRGLMTFWIPEGKHTVDVVFQRTKVRRVSEMISFIGCIVLVISFFYLCVWRKKCAFR